MQMSKPSIDKIGSAVIEAANQACAGGQLVLAKMAENQVVQF